MRFQYTPSGVCSRSVTFDLEDGIVKNASFEGGCNGNLKGICALIEGLPAKDVIARVKGINCAGKGTSCPDQLARALEEALVKEPSLV